MDKFLKVEWWQQSWAAFIDQMTTWMVSPHFYAQLGTIIGVFIIAKILARTLRARVPLLANPPESGRFLKLRNLVHMSSALLFAAIAYVLLGIGAEVVNAVFNSSWLVKIARGIAVVALLYSAIGLFISHPLLQKILTWIAIPLATLQVFGYLDEVTQFADETALELGNIRISLLFAAKALGAGAFFFWLGRLSSTSGQKAIREQESLDIQTKELLAKLFQIGLFALLFIVMMQVLGLDLTTLAVLGGAVGVGLGFGLQQIAANFISGMIILFERSLGVGDYIEMEDGKAGILKELNMRSTTLETFDGKEVMIPNEKFITNTFVNWTRDDPRQRYEVEFSVAYETDLHKVPPLIEAAVSKHPRVLQEPERPDCELRGFGENGVEFGVEFWVDGLDDGANKFSSDVLFLVWDALKEGNIQIPFPQREVRIVGDASLLKVNKGKTSRK